MIKTREEVQNNLTIYKGFTPEEINRRVKRNREKFEERCERQGEHLPGNEQLNRWFKERS